MVMKISLKLSLLLLALSVSAIVSGQEGLKGSWKYVSQYGEMKMQINEGTILINNQSFPYKAQGNVLMITDGTAPTPYPFMLDGNKLTIEFPGGMEIIFTRETQVATAPAAQGQLPQSMARPSAGTGQDQQSGALSGKWLFQSQQGQLVLEFLSANQLSFNGETTQYQLKEGIIQAQGDYGWIDYPYTLNQGILTITFPDGSRFPFTRASAVAGGQQGPGQTGMNQQAEGNGLAWQLKGSLCSWSGSSNSSSSYSRTQKIVFDGQGNFQSGSESSFSSNAGIAYGGNPNAETGRYTVSESTVTLHYRSGQSYVFKINMRQDNGTISELMYSGTLYAKGLCDN